jgi:hypothetical protein
MLPVFGSGAGRRALDGLGQGRQGERGARAQRELRKLLAERAEDREKFMRRKHPGESVWQLLTDEKT